MINAEKYIHKTLLGTETIQELSNVHKETYKCFQQHMHFGNVELENINENLYGIYAIVEPNKVEIFAKNTKRKISQSIMEFSEQKLSKLTTKLFPTIIDVGFISKEDFKIFSQNLGFLNTCIGFWLLEQKVKN